MKYIKKLIRTGGGLVVRVPSDIVKLLNLTEKDYVEMDLTKLDVKSLNKKSNAK
ncbi:MAG TPA: hypothetical protein VJJ52_08215 [Candidatus Nanoarchaeia archaeon]|nr:hypothetical protein [Candidatus Nanoarchaeia archaeon]